ncbi:hypothetical protein LAZ67_3002638, partial [Cordylochernes scorpioides]
MVKEEIGRTLAPISKPRISSPQKERPREFYNNRYVAQTIRPHPEPRYPKQGGRRDTNEWRTTEGKPICFHCGRPGHVVRYCRDRRREYEGEQTWNYKQRDRQEPRTFYNSRSSQEPNDDLPRENRRRYRSPSPHTGRKGQYSSPDRRPSQKCLFEDTPKNSSPLYSELEYRIEPASIQLIEVASRDIPNDAIVVAECRKELLLERELTAPSSVISLTNNRGYWQIDVEESDREKTAFITPDGLYEFKVMPFGLCNAPATFERMIDNLLKGLKWTICLCYLDDIIVFSDGFEEHLRRLQLALNCLKKAGLCLNSKKCKFGAKTITVLGHEVSENGIRPDQEKIRAVRDFATPRSLKEVRSFLGLSSYYRRFIPNYAHVAQPLNDHLKKDSAFNWNQEEQNAFEALKSALISEPALGHFDYSSPTEIHTDASNYGIGAVLVQIQKGKERAIAYASRTLNKAEKNYSTTERECLAIIWAINKFRPYVFGQPFTIVTDHHSLCWLTNLKDPCGRLARWALRLQEFDVTVVYKSGRKHQDADCLSRSPLEYSEDMEEDIPSIVTLQNFSEEQMNDKAIRKIADKLQSSPNNFFVKIYNTLYRKNYDPMGKPWLLVVPRHLRQELLKNFHDSPTAGHLGFTKTYDRIRKKYYWPGMYRTVRRYVAHSSDCQRRKHQPQLPSGHLQPIPVPEVAFEKVGMDLLGRFPTSEGGNRWIIVCTDYLTKYAITGPPYKTKALPTKDQEDQLEEDPEDDSTNFQEEDIPTERTQQPQTREEISGPITRSRALRLRIKFLKDRTTVLEPLHRLLNKRNCWKWKEVEDRAFREAKNLIQSDLVLTPYDARKPLVLACDASPFGVGAVLSHVEEGMERPIAFASRTMSQTERRECLLWGNRVVIPPVLQRRTMEQLHETHPGIVQMKAIARSHVWWPGMDKAIENRVERCENCQLVRNNPKPSPVHPWTAPVKPWSRIHIDYAGPFHGRTFLIVVDSMSKWPEAIIMDHCTATATVRVLRDLFAVHGLPDQVVSDNGRMFVGHEFQEFLRMNGIRHITSAPYHPQTNGQAERVVQTLKQLIRKNGWENISVTLPRALFAMRTTPHGTTGLTPAELLMGRRLTTRMNRLHPKESEDNENGKEHFQNRFKSQENVYARKYNGKGKWEPGKIKTVLGPRNYEVIMENGVTARRHQDQLMRRVKEEVSEDVEKKEECNTERRGEQMNDPNESPERLEETPGPSRPIRNRRLPEYLKDCVTNWGHKRRTETVKQEDSVELKEMTVNIEEATQVGNYFVQHLPRNPSMFSGEDGEDPLTWLKGYKRVAKHNHWDETLCLANVYFYLNGTALKWFENNEETIRNWEEFTTQLESVFGKSESLRLLAEKKLKIRAQLKGESTEFYIQDVLRLCKEVDLQMSEGDKISHLMKGIVEELYQALLPRDINNTDQFVSECRRIEALHRRRVTPAKYERLPNVASLDVCDDNTDLSSMIRQIVREEVQRALAAPREEPRIATIEDMVREEIDKTLAPISNPFRGSPQYQTYTPSPIARRETAAPQTPRPRARYPKQEERLDTNEWRTTEGRPICFHCGRPGHVDRYCRDRRRQNDERENGYSQRRQEPMFFYGPRSKFPALNDDEPRDNLRRYRSPSPYPGRNGQHSRGHTQEQLTSLRGTGIQNRAASCQLIEVLSRDISDNAAVVAESQKGLSLERELMAPSSIISLSSNRGKLWVANWSPYPKIIPQGMHVADGVVIEDSQLCVLAEGNHVGTDIGHSEDSKFAEILNIDDSLDDFQKEKLRNLLRNYRDIFDFRKKEASKTDNVKHRISTGDHLPTKQRPYRVAPAERQIIQEEVNKMEEIGIIQPSASPWASPVVLVRKKDGSWRFCVDYRRLNKITKKDVYPLPRIDDTLDCLQGARFYFSMDLQSRYWQIDVEEADREKTAFITPDGLYEFKVMPFGLCNPPATFERMMDGLLKGLKWTICLCYLDDIVVFSDDFEEHLRRLQLVLGCLRKAGLCLNSGKCWFGAKTITVIGHEVSGDGICLDPEKNRAVRDFPRPKSLKEVRSFLGLSSYYRRFIANYAHIAQPLNSLLKKDSVFSWNIEERHAFEALKSALISEPVLGHFDHSSPTEIHTDASNYGIGTVLAQIQTGKERAIAYASRTLNKAEINYSTTEREYCQRRKRQPQLPPGLLQPIPVPIAAFEKVGMDLLGRFPTSMCGNRWIIVCTDYLTKFAITKALPTSESVEVATFFIKDVILKHGAPREVITDRGRNFTSSMIRDLNKHCRITHRTTTAYHPQTNGLTERLNKTIADMLSMYVDVNQKDWDEILPFVTFAYNTAKQESTGFSPFFLVHGREAETPLDLLFPKFPSEDEDDFIQTLGSRAEEARQLARIHTMRSQGGNKLRYDAHHRNIIYQPGVLVWIYIPVRKVGLSEKLMRRYFGPYKVTRKISDVTYEVETFGDQHGRRKTKDIVHICRMKPYLDPEKREDHLEEDMEDDLSSPQKEEVPAEGRQPPLAHGGPQTRRPGYPWPYY